MDKLFLLSRGKLVECIRADDPVPGAGKSGVVFRLDLGTQQRRTGGCTSRRHGCRFAQLVLISHADEHRVLGVDVLVDAGVGLIAAVVAGTVGRLVRTRRTWLIVVAVFLFAWFALRFLLVVNGMVTGVPSENSVSIENIDVIRSKPVGCPLPC